MPTEIKTTGPIFDYATAEAAAGAAIRQEFAVMGNVLARHIIQVSPEYRGDWKAGVGFVIEGAGLDTTLRIFDDALTAWFTEYGRGPGKQPPPEVMLTWVQARRLAEEEINSAIVSASNLGRGRLLSFSSRPARPANFYQKQKQIAFLIGRAIGRRGLPGFRIFSTLKETMAWYIDDEIERIGARVAEMLAA